MIAVKGNVEYTINEAEKDIYVKNGYDIYKDGKKVADGAHKSVSYEKYEKALNEIKTLKVKNTSNDENKALEEKVSKLEEDLSVKVKEIEKLKEEETEKDKKIEDLEKKLKK